MHIFTHQSGKVYVFQSLTSTNYNFGCDAASTIGGGIQGNPMAREFCQTLFCLGLSMHGVALLAPPLHTPAPPFTAGACALIRIHPFDPLDQEAEASNPQGCKPRLKLDHLRSKMSSISNAAPEDWYVITTLALPHLLYAYIWFNSSTWLKTFGKKSVQRFETAAWLLKGTSPGGEAQWWPTLLEPLSGGWPHLLTAAHPSPHSGACSAAILLGDLLVQRQKA